CAFPAFRVHFSVAVFAYELCQPGRDNGHIVHSETVAMEVFRHGEIGIDSGGPRAYPSRDLFSVYLAGRLRSMRGCREWSGGGRDGTSVASRLDRAGPFNAGDEWDRGYTGVEKAHA